LCVVEALELAETNVPNGQTATEVILNAFHIEEPYVLS